MIGEYLQPYVLIMKPINMILSLFCKTSQVGHKTAETKEKKKSTTPSSTDCFEWDC